jgi:beta-carotene 15,15'-dioxygenase
MSAAGPVAAGQGAGVVDTTTVPTPAIPRRAHPARAATTLSRLLVVLALVGAWLVPPWVVLVAGLLAGLPHGAADHLVPRWWLGPRAPRLAAVLVGYAALAGVSYLAFRAWPAAAVVLFVVVSAWHFGSGETRFADLRAGRALPRSRWRGSAHVVVVLALPALLHPDGLLPLLRVVVAAPLDLGDGVRAGLTAFAVLGVVLALLVVALDLVGGRRAEAVDLLLLLALVVATDPLVAFGVYFGGWHSLRHLARTVVDDPANADALQQGHLGPAVARFAREAAGPTVLALAAVAALWAVADGWEAFASGYLALLAGLTVPHMALVAWADRRRATTPIRLHH